MSRFLGDASVYLVDLKEPRLRRPPCSFQVLLKLRVVHHLLNVFSRLPHVDYHYAIVGSRTGVIYALRLFAGNGMHLALYRRRQGARRGLLPI
jgi:hypothetical protein